MFESDDTLAQQGIYVSDAALTTMTRIDQNLAYPGHCAVSPDGTKVAFILNERLNLINIDGSKIAYRVSGRVKVISAAGGTAIDLFDAGFKEISDKYFIFSGYQFAWR